MIRHKENSQHYRWGHNCDGWHLVESDALSIIQEIMPPDRSEKLHYHEYAQQFFYILKGTASFEIDGEIFEVTENTGFHVFPKQKHRILNKTNSQLEFIVTSQPKSHEDRIEL
ncbi:cupin domain-containing protein [Olivibacter sp. CPCC 100613]|uniref:cupin domain-containing protein n=1 Tax=Olivibacter sp. CPCC 100613 TaxID=3079931 RepID=UPI002FF7BAEF